jgi:enterochelin esterase-like enzyme
MIVNRQTRPACGIALSLMMASGILLATEVQAQWVKPPSAGVLKETPGLVHKTYDSNVMGTTVGYCVVLPAGYETSAERYPVVYWLHGGGGNESSSLSTARSWRKLDEANKTRPVILVYPNGFRSGYMDHWDGKIMVESMIIKELIPRIDSTYRTIASREGRAVHGFSMGASGSLKFAFKYPDMFCSAVAYGGGAIDLENDKSAFIVGILKRNLNADPKLIRQNNTYHFLKQNGDTVRKNGIRFLLICGDKDSWKRSAADFHKALGESRIPCELTIVPDVSHSLGGLTKAKGEAAARFQDEVFQAGLK